MHNTLEQVFGYPQFRAGQEAVVSAVLAGRSAAAIFPTGSGKSLCYQLPALLLPHLTLVVSPLLALMQDQLTFLQRHGIAAASIDSAQSREDASDVMARAKAGELKILMISVERLKNERFRNFLQQVPISLLVVDEAHCISEWGHNFRPDYLKLPDYQRQFNIPQALLLTATATPNVIADMQAKFAIAEADVITTGFYRANLNLWVEPVSGTAKRQRLVQLELRGLIAPRYAYFAEYRFKFLIEPEVLLAKFEGERQQFVSAIIQTSSRARTWATVNFDTLYSQHQADRNRVVKALDYFQEKGWIELESKQMTEVYSLLVENFDAAALSQELHAYFTAHERGEIERIHAMLALFASDTCLSYRLAQYFGDEQAPRQCGHCSVCAGQVAYLPEPPALPPLVDKNFEALCGAFIHKHQEYTGSYPPAERLTRFLCGISVPMFTKIKARAIPGFAALENYPYAEVRDWAAKHLNEL